MGTFVNFSVCCLLISSCSSGTGRLRNMDAVVDISTINADEHITHDNAEEILNLYSIDFQIPNPLYGESERKFRKVDPSHESLIYCRATLLEDFSTEADILVQCLKDSLDEKACDEFRKSYFENHVRDGMFRILIKMESGFSPKSMEPDHWAMYIENAHGVMIEPIDIATTEVTACQDSVFSNYHRIHLPKNVLQRDITLYFNRQTFFGEDLLGEENPYIIFVMSHEREEIARVAWNFTEKKTRN